MEKAKNFFSRMHQLMVYGIREFRRNGFSGLMRRARVYVFDSKCRVANAERMEWMKNRKERKQFLANDDDSSIEKGMVSVIIPVYDRVEELRESIDSILNQTYENLELILVTDGSPQETMKVVESYRNNRKVKIFHYYDNTGNAVRGRNKGIRESKGEYIAFQDSDDIAELDRLERSIQQMNEKKADVVYGGWRAMVDGTRVDTGLKNGQEVMSPDCDFEDLYKNCIPCQSTVMVKHSALMDVGGLKRTMEYREDHELWLRLAYYGYKFSAISEILTNLRLHEGNNELNFKDGDDKWVSMMRKEYKIKSKLSPKIAYIIPGTGISGGVAIVLQHVNRLLERGYDVMLISQDSNELIDWFPNNKVGIIGHKTECSYLLDNIDILVATGWTTAPTMDMMHAKRKVYFVQSDERRFVDDEGTRAIIGETYKIDCEYMTEAIWIQRWLKEEFGHDAHYVPNALDEKIIHETDPIIEKSHRKRVLIEGPINTPFKGMDDAYSAIKDLDCEIWIVSSNGKPPKKWKHDRFFESVPIHEMKEVYSSCDIFLKMSRIEGFFGPPLEAMACGCAVVVGKCTGYDEYIIDGENALVVEMRDIVSAKKSVKRLLEDDVLRNELIKNGYKTSKNWRWGRSIDYLEKMICDDQVKVFYSDTFPEVYCYAEEIKRLDSFRD